MNRSKMRRTAKALLALVPIFPISVARAADVDAPPLQARDDTGAASSGASGGAQQRTGRTSALSWVRLPGADGCIGAPALATAVEARLGRRVFVPPADAEISVEGTVRYRADSKRYKVTFRVADRDGAVLGVRDVEESASSCSVLDERLVFVLSMLIDPEAVLASAAPPSESAASPEPPKPLEPERPAPSASSEPRAAAAGTPAPPRATPPWRWMVGAEVGGAVGVVPDLGALFSGSALVTPPRWPGLRLRASSHFPSSRTITGLARAEVGLVTGALGICPFEPRRSGLGASVCVSGVVGELTARGEGFSESRDYGTLLGAVALEIVGEVSLSRSLLVTLSPTLLLPLTRARLTFDDADGVRRTFFVVAPVGGTLSLGFAVGSR